MDPSGLWGDPFVPQLAVLQEVDPFVLLCPMGHYDVPQGDGYLGRTAVWRIGLL